MGDPFDVDAAIKAIKGSAKEMLAKQQTAQLAKSIMALRNAQANGTAKTAPSISAKSAVSAPSRPVGNSGGGGSSVGGGGTVAAAAVDPNAAMTTLIGGLKTLSDAEIAALMEQVKANYAQYVGDVPTDATGLLQQLLGENFDPTDPNYAAMMADPNIASLMGQFEEMGETGDQNMTTDLNWFLKQQELYNQYLSSLPATLAASAGSGGGGGGGGGYGRGGYGRGGGSGSGDTISGEGNDFFEKEKALLNLDSLVKTVAQDPNTYARPGFMADVQSTPGMTPEEQQIAQELAAAAGDLSGPGWIGNFLEEADLLDEEYEAGQDKLTGNRLWDEGLNTGAYEPAQLQQYLNIMGLIPGDDEDTDAFEGYIPDPANAGVQATADSPYEAAYQAAFQPTYMNFYDPNNYGGVPGQGQEKLAADFADVNTIAGRFRRGYGDTVMPHDNGIAGGISNFLNPRQRPQQTFTLEDFMPPEQGPSSDDYILDDTQLPEPEADWFYANSEDARNSNSTTSYNDYMHIPPEDMTQRDFELAYYNMPAVDQLRQYMFETRGDPNARRAYWEDVYPNLLPSSRIVVDRFLEQSGIRVPNEAAAAYAANNGNLTPESNLVDRQNQAKLAMIARAVQGAGIVQKLMGSSITNPNQQITREDLMQRVRQNRRGEYTQPFVESLRDYSDQLRQSMGGPNLEGEAFDPEPGEYYDQTAPDLETVREQRTRQRVQDLMSDIYFNNYDVNQDMVQTEANLNNTAQQSAGLQIDLTDTDGSIYPAGTADADEILELAPDPDGSIIPFGSGESFRSGPRGFMSRIQSALPGLIAQKNGNGITDSLQKVAARRITPTATPNAKIVQPKLTVTGVKNPTVIKSAVNTLGKNAKKKVRLGGF